jgi:hypothetical protein
MITAHDHHIHARVAVLQGLSRTHSTPCSGAFASHIATLVIICGAPGAMSSTSPRCLSVPRRRGHRPGAAGSLHRRVPVPWPGLGVRSPRGERTRYLRCAPAGAGPDDGGPSLPRPSTDARADARLPNTQPPFRLV